ncbi:MAG: hypothetical protein LBQ47_04895, partial [Endomicrobium sp.]|nr:hypothetical protein [Endomicrobium sp.]
MSSYTGLSSAISNLSSDHDINFTGSSIIFNGTLPSISGAYVNFYSNSGAMTTLLAHGNRIFQIKNSTATFNAPITFQDAYAAGDGAALELYPNAAVYFRTSSTVAFYNNKATQYGGAVDVWGNSSAHFENNTYVNFTSNTAMLSGGAVNVANNSNLYFKNNFSVNFSANISSVSAGAIYLNDIGSAEFSDTNYLRFDGNKAYNSSDGGGGAIYVSASSSLYFSNNNSVVFTNNSAQNNGGAIYVLSSSASFNNNNSVIFENNEAASSGGALYASKSNISIASSTVEFLGNNAASGGALFLDDSIVNFINSVVYFAGNSAVNGGAIYSDNNAELNFDSGARFSNNSASSSGGAAHISGGASATFTDSIFENNSAVYLGGAIYVNNASVTFITNSETRFSGNTADNLSNDLYLGSGAKAYFTNINENSVVNMYGGIAGVSGAKIFYGGQGNFNFYGDASSNNADVKINGKFNLMGSANFRAGEFYNDTDGILNMSDGSGAVNKLEADSFVSKGTVIMDVMIVESGFLNDSIDTESLDLDDATRLKLVLNDVRFDSATFSLIHYNSAAPLTLQNIDLEFIGADPISALLEDSNNWINLVLKGKGLQTNFSSIGGLTKNQFSAASAYDLLSAHTTIGTDLHNVISNIEMMPDADSKKSAFTQASGHFLANVIRSKTLINESYSLYSRISSIDALGNGMWAQMQGGNVSNEGDKESPGKFSASRYGALLGYDRFFAGKNLLLGAYVKYEEHDMEQSADNADMTDIGFGVYGAYIKDKFELKGLLSADMGSYDVERRISFMPGAIRTAESDFQTYGFVFDAEGLINIDVNDTDLKLSPYAAIEIDGVNYGEITEKGAQSFNLNVSG